MIEKYLQKNPIAYVTRDKERATGLQEIEGQYLILTNASQPTATHTLLTEQDIEEIINTNSANIVVFKNTSIIERICREHHWNLLNPSASLAQEIEDKISQVHWLNELAQYLPKYFISDCADIDFDGTPFILQFNRAHTGSGTYFINTKKQLDELKKQFPDRPAKISQYITGPVLTCNVVVTTTDILFGNISYQITGLEPFTQNPFATIGNDWNVANTILSSSKLASPTHDKETKKEKILEIGKKIGKKMQSQGWIGLFGIDIIIDEKTDTVYLLEINARQPASTTFESTLQRKSLAAHAAGSDKNITTFDAHLTSLLKKDVDQNIIPITHGAQILLRNTEQLLQLDPEAFNTLVNNIKKLNYTVTVYPDNDKMDADKIRIQSTESFISHHNELNEAGKQLAQIILQSYESN